ncbi:ABC transporter permease [Paenibacillus sp. HWE-109]|uniref:ABC transporter permease n=1 Tax=Paenibacillus sp. HWE-109 TaxID=1306526 RepID=UPI001EDF7C47|nr:ABC transporter permease [Paenibacillus sp. HWE-109]UKS25179.1 ABC transporter permease [Paenibacillus sp. HWE-109]
MHAFRRLVLTDLRNRRNTIWVTLGAMALLNVAVAILTRHRQLPDELGFIMFLNIMVFAAGLLIPFLHCFSTWLDEWKQHSIYQLLILPVPRTYLLVSKYISILVEVMLITAVMIAGLWMQHSVNGEQLFRAEPLVTFEWSKVLLVIKWFLSVTCCMFLCSASILIGKCCGRLSLLVSFLSFIAGLFLWIIAFANFMSTFTLVIVSLVFFMVSYYLLNKKVGVE